MVKTVFTYPTLMQKAGKAPVRVMGNRFHFDLKRILEYKFMQQRVGKLHLMRNLQVETIWQSILAGPDKLSVPSRSGGPLFLWPGQDYSQPFKCRPLGMTKRVGNS